MKDSKVGKYLGPDDIMNMKTLSKIINQRYSLSPQEKQLRESQQELEQEKQLRESQQELEHIDELQTELIGILAKHKKTKKQRKRMNVIIQELKEMGIDTDRLLSVMKARIALESDERTRRLERQMRKAQQKIKMIKELDEELDELLAMPNKNIQQKKRMKVIIKELKKMGKTR